MTSQDAMNDAAIEVSEMTKLVATRLQERQEQDEKVKTRTDTLSDHENKWPPFWPILKEEWPLKDGVVLVRVFETLPPTFLLSDGRRINGEYMIDVIRSACAEANLDQVSDVMKMEALNQILLYKINLDADLADNVAFLIGLNCPVNGRSKQYEPPLTMVLRRARPQQVKIIRMLIAAGADCEAARDIANQKFDNLWDMICT